MKISEPNTKWILAIIFGGPALFLIAGSWYVSTLEIQPRTPPPSLIDRKQQELDLMREQTAAIKELIDTYRETKK